MAYKCNLTAIIPFSGLLQYLYDSEMMMLIIVENRLFGVLKAPS